MSKAVRKAKGKKTTGEGKSVERLLRFILRGPCREVLRGACRPEPREPSLCALRLDDGTELVVPTALVETAVARGLASRTEGILQATSAVRSYLRRAAADRDEAFLHQHGAIADAMVEIDSTRQRARVNSEASPLASLGRLKEKDGSRFLPEQALAAGERLLADFTRGQLQPRVTASWEPRLASRGSGLRGGMADLNDGAVAARIAVNRAVEAMGPELSGVALDVCCFMKGLETVERERQWPVRSAKLMLRTALMALSRHYDPPRHQHRPRMEHWGVEGYRPEL
ncbi:DUF6456 domain-containing protein [Rhizobium sp. S152]|uniref:DUF6456 domain-containing protein n=1 Tax=Rhizobium sp. S152 TaxID=3055038 RepID=UPI0025AA1971|nr:DUF6456 domain-containing protein [Rhizobium sp. S152]MDM9627097.1 DUF6456 domain-containing protein [Rhizobium sp. S152]